MKKYTFLLIVLLACAFLACNNTGKPAPDAPKAATAAAVKTIQVSVAGMTCEGCESTIKESVGKVKGVQEVNASFKDGKATVKYDTTQCSKTEISAAIVKAGYEVNQK